MVIAVTATGYPPDEALRVHRAEAETGETKGALKRAPTAYHVAMEVVAGVPVVGRCGVA